MKRHKKYKQKHPSDTITDIKQILKEIGMEYDIEPTNSLNSFPSFRLDMGKENMLKLRIGTNGKGMNAEYAQASAYGEYMERLQNGVLFSRFYGGGLNQFNEIKISNAAFADEILTSDTAPLFNSVADEKIISREELLESVECMQLSHEMRESLLDFYADKSSIYAIPFWSVDNEVEVCFPLSGIYALLGSNGMCAGNTPCEAILQGICEIFERFAMREVFFGNIVMPDIPLEYFEGTEIAARLRRMAEEDISISIKDASCNLGLPVLCVVIVDKKAHRYLCNFGSDPSPITALERCVTEMFQGCNKLRFRDIDLEVQVNIDNDEKSRQQEMFATYSKGIGHYPASILVGEPSYDFNGFFSPGESDEEDLALLLKLLKKHKFSVYIRNSSFTAIPAYWVYIPRMSEAQMNLSELLTIMDNRGKIFQQVRRLGDLTSDELKDFTRKLNRYSGFLYTLASMNTKDLFLFGNAKLFLAILNYRAENVEESKRILQQMLGKKCSCKEDALYHALYDYIFAEQEGIDLDKLANLHSPIYLEVADQLLHGDKWWQMFKIPPCFDCQNCSYADTCCARLYYSIRRKTDLYFLQHLPNQEQIKTLYTATPICQ